MTDNDWNRLKILKAHQTMGGVMSYGFITNDKDLCWYSAQACDDMVEDGLLKFGVVKGDNKYYDVTVITEKGENALENFQKYCSKIGS